MIKNDIFEKSINFWSLKFNDTKLNSEFHDYNISQYLFQLRLAHVLAALFFSLAVWGEHLFLAEYVLSPTIRLLVVVPSFFLGLIITFVKPQFYKKYYHIFNVYYVIITAISFIFSGSGAIDHFKYNLYSGIIISLIFNYTFIRQKFILATGTGFFVLFLYYYIVFFYEAGERIFIHVSLYITVAHLLGMFICYFIEFDSKKRFLLLRQLKEQQEKLVSLNNDLENQVANRTKEILQQNEKAVEAQKLLTKQNEEIELNNERLEGLLRISRYRANSVQDLLDYALMEAIQLTNSKIGYIYFYNDEKKQFILNTWSNEVMKECKVVEPQTTYALDDTGCWGEVVRQKKPIIINNYNAPNEYKKGTPDGHVGLSRFMSIPVFYNERIVATAGVANKETDYTDIDVNQLTLLMDSVWRISEQTQVSEELEKSLKEKEMLIRELYHRTKNNMQLISSMINLQSRNIKDTQVQTIFRELQGRIMGVALVHKKLYESNDLSYLDFKEYLTSIVQLFSDNFLKSYDNIEIEIKGQSFNVLMDTALPCGIIINEILTNAIKYSFKNKPPDKVGRIMIQLNYLSAEQFEMIVQDNGNGLPKGFDFERDAKLGLRSIFDLTEYQLGGKVVMKDQNGLYYQFVFEKELYKKRV